MAKTNKTKTTKNLTNKRSNSQMTPSEKYKIEKEKLELEREKWDHKVKKDRKNGAIGIIVGLPIFIIIVTFTIIWVVILTRSK